MIGGKAAFLELFVCCMCFIFLVYRFLTFNHPERRLNVSCFHVAREFEKDINDALLAISSKRAVLVSLDHTIEKGRVCAIARTK